MTQERNHENTASERHVWVDRQAQQRFNKLVATGKTIFAGSHLLASSEDFRITESDLVAVQQFLESIAPTNPDDPWRLDGVDATQVGSVDADLYEATKQKILPNPDVLATKNQMQNPLVLYRIMDPSTFASWELPGSTAESNALAMRAGLLVSKFITDHQKPLAEVAGNWQTVSRKVPEIDSYRLAAAAGLHDAGRALTHIFYTNEVINNVMLKKIGIREDILRAIPDEHVMVTPPEQDINEVMRELEPEAVLMWMCDDFAKRKGGTNRLLQPEDIDPVYQFAWARRYTDRQFSGRPSDRWMRENMEQHGANAERYVDALDNWVRNVTDVTLSDVTRMLNEKLAPEIPTLKDTVLLSSVDLLDGQPITRTLEVGNTPIQVEAFTRIGGPSKRFNEDACVILTHDTAVEAIVVDGGTQLEQVPSLASSGGKHIADQVVAFGQRVNMQDSLGEKLAFINSQIREDNAAYHTDIVYGVESKNVPYASIAAVKVDTDLQLVEIANAGDVFVVTEDKAGGVNLVSNDTVYEYDQMTFAVARAVAEKHGVTVREAMENRDTDPRFSSITRQMLETMKAGTTGVVERITGAESFTTPTHILPLQDIAKVHIFTDGVVPAGIDIHTDEGLHAFVAVSNTGDDQLIEAIEQAAEADQDFSIAPRFRHRDDSLKVTLTI